MNKLNDRIKAEREMIHALRVLQCKIERNIWA